MLRKILGTTGTRLLNAVINLVILLVITNKIGSEGLGVIALIMVDITIIQMLIDLVSGSALIYYSSRANLAQLLIPAYTWIIIVIAFFSLTSTAIQFLYPSLYLTIVPAGYEIHILALAILNALMIIHYNLLLGRERIKTYNIIFTVQIIALLAVFIFEIYIGLNFSPIAYVKALYVAYFIGALISFIAIIKKAEHLNLKGWKLILSKVVIYGIVSFSANIINVGNKRLSFYVLRYFTGLSALGVYNAGVQLSEGIRIIGQSISLVQFSKISNTDSLQYAKELTLKLLKFTLVLTLFAVLILIAIPEYIYTWVFSKDFSDVKPIIIALSPGILALAANNILSHYFSGLGNPKVNLWATLVGFVFTIVLAFTLIPEFGYIGAAITASVSYTSTVVYQYIIFKKHTKIRLSDWIPDKSDVKDFVTLCKDFIKPDD